VIRNVIVLLTVITLYIPCYSVAESAKGVVVSIKPLHSLVSGVMGDTGEAKLLLPDNNSPHDIYLKPSQVMLLQDADIIFYIDDKFELFLGNVFNILPEHIRKVPVMHARGITILSSRDGDAWDAHLHDDHASSANEDKHDEHYHDDHASSANEDKHDEHYHDDHASSVNEDKHDEHYHDDHASSANEDKHDEHHYDMHVWLDPYNARKIVNMVKEELSIMYPENRDIYNKNASDTINKIDMMDDELKESLDGLSNKPFIVFHDAYQYFEKAYSLLNVGSVSFDTHESLSPSRIKEVRRRLIQTDARCVFSEPQFSSGFAIPLIEGTDTKIGELDPIGTGIENGAGLYFKMMRNIANNLKKCLR